MKPRGLIAEDGYEINTEVSGDVESDTSVEPDSEDEQTN